MVNAREWLDKNYPKQLRSKVDEIYLNEPNLEGELDLSDFVKLEEVCVSRVLEEKILKKCNLKISNKNEQTKVIKLKDTQKWLDENYPPNGVCIREDEYHKDFGKKRAEIEELEIALKYLEGELDLSDFVNLKSFDCSINYLTSLNLSNCLNLEEIICEGNQLTNLDLSNLGKLQIIVCHHNRLTNINYPTSNPENLLILNIANNNLVEQDLSDFSKFPNLERLIVGNDIEKREIQKIYNRFTGSLKHLSHLKKLELLNIDSTKVDSELEYLPDNLEKISCTGSLATTLKKYFIDNEKNYDYQAWRQANLPSIKQIHEYEKLLVIFKEIQVPLAREKTLINPLNKTKEERVIDNITFYLEENNKRNQKRIVSRRWIGTNRWKNNRKRDENKFVRNKFRIGDEIIN